MPAFVPVRAMKDTAQFMLLVKSSSSPVVVTRNGKDAMAVMTNEAHEALKMRLARAELFERIARSENKIAEGKHSGGAEFVSQARAKYGIQVQNPQSSPSLVAASPGPGEAAGGVSGSRGRKPWAWRSRGGRFRLSWPQALGLAKNPGAQDPVSFAKFR